MSDAVVLGKCSHIQSCPMFSLFVLPGTMNIWKVRYCDKAHTTCARYQRSLEQRTVPDNLLPNGEFLRK